jgi:hypothetical protein
MKSTPLPKSFAEKIPYWIDPTEWQGTLNDHKRLIRRTRG